MLLEFMKVNRTQRDLKRNVQMKTQMNLDLFYHTAFL